MATDLQLKEQVKEIVKAENLIAQCELCKEDSLYMWRVQNLEKRFDSRDKEIKTSMKELHNSLSEQKNVLIATLTSAILTLIAVIAMFIANGVIVQ